jgi:hypothetical protein
MFDHTQLRGLSRKELMDVIGSCKTLIQLHGINLSTGISAGSRVTYVSGKTGNRVFGRVIKKNRTRAVVKEEISGLLWNVPFSMLEVAPSSEVTEAREENVLQFTH